MDTITATDFATVLLVNQTPAQVFQAINNVGGWWTTTFEGHPQQHGGVFTVRFGETYITCKIVELIAGKKIVWLVTDCNKPWLKDKKEWKGTTISWEISGKGDITEISFRHVGLVPGIECFEVCSNAWGSYIHNSLLSLISTGKGQPTKAK
jgi:hypothetical protein